MGSSDCSLCSFSASCIILAFGACKAHAHPQARRSQWTSCWPGRGIWVDRVGAACGLGAIVDRSGSGSKGYSGRDRSKAGMWWKRRMHLYGSHSQGLTLTAPRNPALSQQVSQEPGPLGGRHGEQEQRGGGRLGLSEESSCSLGQHTCLLCVAYEHTATRRHTNTRHRHMIAQAHTCRDSHICTPRLLDTIRQSHDHGQ